MAEFDTVLKGGMVAEERLAQEAALLATRADIREELDRLRAHIQDARILLAGREAAGRWISNGITVTLLWLG